MSRNRSVRWLAFAVLMISFSAAAYSQVFVSVRIGPPALPIYAQPICPGPGFIWTPGYWAWNDDGGYYWVPGTWVVAPLGLYWTPGYWGWNEGFYAWHGGYWGPHIGFYGGINYGFGYTGVGFAGGYWERDRFFYNRSVTNVNVTNVTNVYNKTVIVNNTTINNVSYNGGTGGVSARPLPQELAAEHEQHREPLSTQMQHEHAASQNRQLFASANQGRPPVAATARPADFSSHAVVPAKAAGAPYHAPAISPREARGPVNAGNRPMTAANSNNPGQKPNQGFRPFTPPNSKGANAAPASRPTGDRPSGNRPFSPPARNNDNQRPANNATRNDNGNGGTNPPRGNTRQNSPSPQSQPRQQSEPRPQQSRPSPPPREAAPRHESAPPARHESAPAPPQRHENPPKQEKERNPGKGR